LESTRSAFLIAGAVLSALAAAMHVGCIIFGAPWYRFFGAGERMAQMAIAGSWFPVIVTAAIATMLATWSLYALSAAGVVPQLPFLRPVLTTITAVYVLRGLAVLPLVALSLVANTPFWWCSSTICLFIGVVHLIGLAQVWSRW
jgi:hypothetical protein